MVNYRSQRDQEKSTRHTGRTTRLTNTQTLTDQPTLFNPKCPVLYMYKTQDFHPNRFFPTLGFSL